jgi:hypothetical protein
VAWSAASFSLAALKYVADAAGAYWLLDDIR